MNTRVQRKFVRQNRKSQRRQHRLAVAQGREEGKYFPGILTGVLLLFLPGIAFTLTSDYYAKQDWVEVALFGFAAILFISGIRMISRATKTGWRVWRTLLWTVLMLLGLLLIVFFHYNSYHGIDNIVGLVCGAVLLIVGFVLQCFSLKLPKGLKQAERAVISAARPPLRSNYYDSDTYGNFSDTDHNADIAAEKSSGGLLGALLIAGLVIAGLHSSGDDTPYVLNKKSGVIHSKWDNSVSTISEKHRVDISRSKADELVSRGTKYRHKK